MTSSVSICLDHSGRRTFDSESAFRSRLGLRGNSCMATTANKDMTPCGRPLSKKRITRIEADIKHFIEAGFPSEEAEESLWDIARNSICGVNRGKGSHRIFVEKTSPRATQDQHLYNKWHRKLWDAYYQDQNPGNFYSIDRDMVPPPLNALPETWSDRAVITPKPPLIRSLTERVATSRRLAELIDRLNFHMPRRGGATSRQREAGRIPKADASSSNTDAANRGTTESLPPNKPLPSTNGLSPSSSKLDVERHIVASVTPRRPPLPRNPNVQGRSTIDRSDETDLAPSPDSFNTTIASSVFSKEDEGDMLGTPLSGSYSISSAQLNCPPESRRSAAENGSPIRPKARRSATRRTGEAGLRVSARRPEDSDAKGEADLEVYRRDRTEKVPLLVEKLRKLSPCIEVDWDDRLKTDEETQSAERRQPTETEPTKPQFDEMKLNSTPKENLKNIILGLHQPILDSKKSTAGWLYGFTLAGCENHIKIGVTDSLDDRMGQTAWRCKEEPIVLFRALLPCAAKLIEKMVHWHLYKQRRRTKCPGCGSLHEEWFEIELEVALDSVLKWTAFSKCTPFVEGIRCFGTYWHQITVPVWDKEVAKRDPVVWVDKSMFPAVLNLMEGKDAERKGERE